MEIRTLTSEGLFELLVHFVEFLRTDFIFGNTVILIIYIYIYIYYKRITEN